jgi:hypothetical protein
LLGEINSNKNNVNFGKASAYLPGLKINQKSYQVKERRNLTVCARRYNILTFFPSINDIHLARKCGYMSILGGTKSHLRYLVPMEHKVINEIKFTETLPEEETSLLALFLVVLSLVP